MGTPNLDTNAVPVFLVNGDASSGGFGQPVANGGSGVQPTGTNRSGTITTGGTAQQLAPANAARRSLTLQASRANTASLWINDTGGTASATSGSYEVVPGGSFTATTGNAHSIFGTVTGLAWTASEG